MQIVSGPGTQVSHLRTVCPGFDFIDVACTLLRCNTYLRHYNCFFFKNVITLDIDRYLGKVGVTIPFCFSKLFLVDTFICPFWRPLVPLFWISGDVSSGFQSQSGFYLICLFCGGECNVHSLTSKSGAPPTNMLTAIMVAGRFPTCLLNVFGGHIGMSDFGATGTPILDFW